MLLLIISCFVKFLNFKLIIGVVNNPVKNFNGQTFIKKLYPKADLIIANSYGIKQSMINHWNITPEKIRVIHNGVDLNSIRKKIKEMVVLPKILLESKYSLLVFAGRLSPQKGLDDMFRALKQINKKHPCFLLIVGEGTELDKLMKLANELDLKKMIHFIGSVKNPFVYIDKADVLVLSSRYEGCPNVVLEAMACNVPVVSTNAPFGPNEIIKDGWNGFLTRVGDWKQMADRVLQVLENDNLRQSFICNGKKRIVEHFNLEKMCEQYEKAFFSWNENINEK